MVDAEDSEEAEAFCLQGEELDIDDLLETAFILDMESKSLCRPDCKGLCPQMRQGPERRALRMPPGHRSKISCVGAAFG